MNNMDAKYAVVVNGEIAYYLNKHLAERQEISDEQLKTLKELHVTKLELFERANQAINDGDVAKLPTFAASLEVIEFDMQKNWNFPLDRNMHEWYKLPGCQCPYYDNADARGSNHRIVISSCPAHGNSIVNAVKQINTND